MKKAALLVALLLMSFLAPSPSHAAEDGTVEAILEICESDETTAEVACVAIINGVAGMMNMNCGFSAQGYSVPEFMKMDSGEATNNALVQAFKNWARDNPQHWSNDKLTGITFALSSTFPCKK